MYIQLVYSRSEDNRACISGNGTLSVLLIFSSFLMIMQWLKLFSMTVLFLLNLTDHCTVDGSLHICMFALCSRIYSTITTVLHFHQILHVVTICYV